MPPKLESGSKTAAGHFWCLGVLLVFGIVFYHRVLFLGEVLTGGDQNYLHYAWKVYFVDSIREGVFPFWNPYPFCGAPFFHDIQTATLYPPDWVYFFLPLPWALGFSHFLHTVLAGWFFYFLSGKFLSEKKARLFYEPFLYGFGVCFKSFVLGKCGVDGCLLLDASLFLVRNPPGRPAFRSESWSLCPGGGPVHSRRTPATTVPRRPTAGGLCAVSPVRQEGTPFGFFQETRLLVRGRLARAVGGFGPGGTVPPTGGVLGNPSGRRFLHVCR